MYSVTKEFSFCYGHRLLGDPGKCRSFHGHTARVAITIESEKLDECGMVCHFDELKKKIGKWIENTLDHKTVLSKNDPLIKALKECGENVLVVDENPTAEFIAKLVYDQAIKEDLQVVQVEVWESPTAKATYRG